MAKRRLIESDELDQAADTVEAPQSTFAHRLLARLQRWADAGWSGSVTFAWGLLQGCIVPGFADLFFIPLSVARPQRAFRLAAIASAGTIAGSVVLYLVGAQSLALIEGPIASFVRVTPEKLTATRAAIAEYGGLAILASTVSPLSTKLTSIASGVAGVPFSEFVLFLSAGRVARTFATAWIIRNGGAEWIQKVLGVRR